MYTRQTDVNCSLEDLRLNYYQFEKTGIPPHQTLILDFTASQEYEGFPREDDRAYLILSKSKQPSLNLLF